MADRESRRVKKPNYSVLAEVLDYIPLDVLSGVLKVFKYGEQKYAKDNWRTPPYLAKEEITDSLLSHTFAAIRDPDSVDHESGLYHASHVMANAIFLTVYVMNGWLKPVEDSTPDLRESVIKKLEAYRKTLGPSVSQPPPAPTPSPSLGDSRTAMNVELEALLSSVGDEDLAALFDDEDDD